jgi:hypothetical protein
MLNIHQNGPKILGIKHFEGHCLLVVGHLCEGLMDNLLFWTNQIARIF